MANFSQHLIKCPEMIIECAEGCKRKFLSDHNNLEKTNHLNLDKKFNEKKNNKENKRNNLQWYNLILRMKKEEESFNFKEAQIIQDLDISKNEGNKNINNNDNNNNKSINNININNDDNNNKKMVIKEKKE